MSRELHRGRPGRQARLAGATLITGALCLMQAAISERAGAAPAPHPLPPSASLARLASTLRRTVLDNGLVLLSREDKGAPLVSIQVWIGAGAAQEQEFLGGGLSHLIEHMIFKGTEQRPPGVITREINDRGGSVNAYTSLDRTVFLTDIPARHWRDGLAVLADAVQNACFPDDEWQREKDVIRREMAMTRDKPDWVLYELLLGTAYRIHPYRVPIIGYRPVFDRLQRADLQAFFKRHYLPNNAIVAVVGDVAPEALRAEVERLFGAWPRQAYPPVVLPSEPPQISPRDARKEGAWTVSRLAWAWHTVGLSHPDAPALDLLAAIVGQGRSSRLARELKENQKLVTEIEAWSFTPLDPGLFCIRAVFEPGREGEVRRALETEITRWSETPFLPEELDKARRQALTATLSAFETMDGQAAQLASGEFYAGAPDFFLTTLRRLEAVTPETLRDTARRYLRPDTLTRCTLAPEAGAPGAEPSAERKGETAGKPSDNKPDSASRNPDSAIRNPQSAIHKAVLPNGLVVLTRSDPKLPLVHIQVVFGGGLLLETEADNGLSKLMADLLTRGTARRPAAALAELIESRGGSLTAFSGQNSLGLSARCLKEDAGLFLELIADCLLHPAFEPDEVAKQKAVQLAAIRQQRESPLFEAREAVRRALFPNHPYRLTPEGNPEAVAALTRAELRACHARTVVGGNMVAAIFGDLLDSEAARLAEHHLAAIPAGLKPALIHDRPAPELPQTIALARPREQTVLVMGFPGIDVKDPRRDALDLLCEALNGLSSDLMIRIRDERGLAYYAGFWQQPGVDPGYLAFYAGTRADAAETVEALILEEARRMAGPGLRAEEFNRALEQVLANHHERLQRNRDVALDCALHELYGLGYAYVLDLERRMRSLTADDVRRAAADLLLPDRRALAVVKPETTIR